MARFCSNCGNEVDVQAYVCPACGIKLINNNVNKIVDNGGFFWSLLGFFIPVVGLILYCVWKKERPNTAKSVGKGALISVIIGFVIYIIVMILFGLIFTGFISEL